MCDRWLAATKIEKLKCLLSALQSMLSAHQYLEGYLEGFNKSSSLIEGLDDGYKNKTPHKWRIY
jgi:hypothetical protein